MKILFLIPRLMGGGAERVVSVLASKLAELDYDVYVIIHRDMGTYDISEKVHVINLELPDSNYAFVKIINLIRACYKISKFKRRLDIHHSISFLETTNLENVLTGKKDKKIISIRTLTTMQNYPFSKRVMVVIANLLSDRIVTLSKGVENDTIENYWADRKKTITIYNPLNLERILQMADERIDDDSFGEIRAKFKMIYVSAGRLIKSKGFDRLIRAFAEFAKENKDSCLLIFGEGEIKHDLMSLITLLGMENQIYLMGFKSNIYKYLKNSDVFVFYSRYEGLGNIILEAMACSLPIITCDYRYGAREMLAPGQSIETKTDSIEFATNGILVKDSEREANYGTELEESEKYMADAIATMKNDAKLREQYRQKSFERASEFTIERIIAQWDELLKKVDVV